MPDVSFATDDDLSTSRSLLTFGGPYIDAVIIIPYMKRMIAILSLINSKTVAKWQKCTGGIDITEQDIQNTGA